RLALEPAVTDAAREVQRLAERLAGVLQAPGAELHAADRPQQSHALPHAAKVVGTEHQRVAGDGLGLLEVPAGEVQLALELAEDRQIRVRLAQAVDLGL